MVTLAMTGRIGGLVLSDKSVMIRNLACRVIELLVVLQCCSYLSLAVHLSETKQHQRGVSEFLPILDDTNQVVWPPISHWSPERGRFSTKETFHGRSRRQRRLSPSEGNVKVLVLLIQWPDHTDRVLPTVADIQTLCEQQITPYFYQQSYGKYSMSCDVQDWVTADNTEQYYSAGNYGRTQNIEIQKIFHPALNKLDQEAAAAGNLEFWMQYDVDSDGKIDSVLAIHSGYGAEFGGNDCTNNLEPSNRIQSQAWAGSEEGGWVSAAETLNYGLGGFAVVAGLEQFCGEIFLLVGKAAHELTHTLGPSPPDLYDVSSGGKGAGGFDIMANAYGPSGRNGKAPGSMSPWTKQYLNWITPVEITANGDYFMRPSTDYPDYFVIKSGFPDKEYLMLEFRVPVAPWDEDFFGQGMILYHIDDAADLQTQPGFPEQGDFPQNGKHYQVAVVQADGLFQLEQGEGNGDEGDLFTTGMSIGPGPNTFPNTDTYQGGQVTQTGITISVVAMNSTGLTFRVEGLAGSAPVPSSSAAPTTAVPLTALPTVVTTAPTPTVAVSPSSSPTLSQTAPSVSSVTATPTVQSPNTTFLPGTTSAPTTTNALGETAAPMLSPRPTTPKPTFSPDGSNTSKNPSSSPPPSLPLTANITSTASPTLQQMSCAGIQRIAFLLTASLIYMWVP